MASKVKTCLQLSNVFKSSKSCQISMISRQFAALTQVRADAFVQSHPLLGVNSQHLPGNRFQALPKITSQILPLRHASEADTRVSWAMAAAGIAESVEDYTPVSNDKLKQAITHKIDETLEQGSEGRLFACVYVRSLQYKVTPGDIIVIRHDFPPNVGDKLRLEKVLAVGGADFTLFGTPILGRDKVYVEATVVEKTLSENRVWFSYIKRTRIRKFRLYRENHSMLVINSIRVAKLGPSDHQQIEGEHQTRIEEQN